MPVTCTCTICGESFVPLHHWCEEWCSDCRINFRASDELRLRAEVEPMALTLSPRQVQAMLRLAARPQGLDAEDEA